ncbi:NADAR family protein [Sphingomonas sp. So64.6b]|uniref:NADAR family protein n=1 Tax=Sphingomonas sp. So64.6b TaxID=2997354 RepID=UPI0015FFDAAD|nr:NADAR family protein [Sphingomonas sp. So64.6b]QNA86527.1 NADAR family protein [Sphingomonas sp. So64.6b]
MGEALWGSRLSPADLPDPAHFATFSPFIRGVFSQWHATPFTVGEHRFVTAEQWMMFAKAILFDDVQRAKAIMATVDPAQQKRYGQLVEGFRQDVWDEWKIAIVYTGNLEKFRQNLGAGRQLKATASAMLVEANARDWIWGAGLGMDDPAVRNPAEWRGANLLGRILTKVRADVDET